MRSSVVQMVCLALGVIGLFGVIVCCIVPRWIVYGQAGSDTLTAQPVFAGLWLTCVVESTGQPQCGTYGLQLIQPSDLQAARAMTIISCLTCYLSLLILCCGSSFTNCVENKDTQANITLVALVGLLLTGLLVIIPVSSFAYYQRQLRWKTELGECIYVGWAAGVLLILAGVLQACCSGPKSGSSQETAKFYSSTVYCNIPTLVRKKDMKKE